jgi:hypothetical protein
MEREMEREMERDGGAREAPARAGAPPPRRRSLYFGTVVGGRPPASGERRSRLFSRCPRPISRATRCIRYLGTEGLRGALRKRWQAGRCDVGRGGAGRDGGRAATPGHVALTATRRRGFLQIRRGTRCVPAMGTASRRCCCCRCCCCCSGPCRCSSDTRPSSSEPSSAPSARAAPTSATSAPTAPRFPAGADSGSVSR